MRKLRLNAEDLRVDSFRPQETAGQAGGTVHANQETWPFRCTMFCTCNCTGIPCFDTRRPGC